MPPTATPKPDTKTLVYQAVNAAFPDRAVIVAKYDLGHSKLMNRGITVPQIGIKVQFETPKGNFAIASMIPETATEADITQLVGRLKADAIKHEGVLTPRPAI